MCVCVRINLIILVLKIIKLRRYWMSVKCSKILYIPFFFLTIIVHICIHLFQFNTNSLHYLPSMSVYIYTCISLYCIYLSITSSKGETTNGFIPSKM